MVCIHLLAVDRFSNSLGILAVDFERHRALQHRVQNHHTQPFRDLDRVSNLGFQIIKEDLPAVIVDFHVSAKKSGLII